MKAFALDTSALIAILNAEPETEAFKTILQDAEHVAVSAATLHEARCVTSSTRFRDGHARLETLLSGLPLEVVSFDEGQLEAASAAYRLFGRGSGHAAHLNMGDCFSYALAKTRGLPLLFKGDDFARTDIQPAFFPT
ncbi:MAG: VapC toxin family PIN domain ribonuclease [Mesorhizobium amorphae]|nr:MAG: VapC toxin family PIN domain ribonuclease [Mesorhizobium amorphae]